MKKKNFISLSVSLVFLGLACTGLLLYFAQKNKTIESIHSLFGVVFIGFAIFHIINNWSSLISYIKERSDVRVKKEFVLAASIALIILAGTALSLPPFSTLAHAGEDLFRAGGPGRGKSSGISFEEIRTNTSVNGTSIEIMIQKNSQVKLPVVAVWVEDSLHHFVNNLFVPAKILAITDEDENVDEAIADGELEFKDFTPSFLPTFSSNTTDQNPNFENATPNENFILKTNTPAIGIFYVMLEIKNGGKTELYNTVIDLSKGNFFKLKAENGTLLIRGVAEVN